MSPEKRITVYPAGWARRVVGDSSPACNWAIECWARAMMEAEKTIMKLKREEWNFLADAINGTMVLDSSRTYTGAVLAIEAEDAQRLNRTGDKWFGEDAGDERTQLFVAELCRLSYIHSQYIIRAVSVFWERSQTVNHQTDEWWTVGYWTRPETVEE